MLHILKAIVVGTLSYLVRRLGISLILFAYLYAQHSDRFAKLAGSNAPGYSHIWLAGLVIALGILIILFRSLFTHYSQRLDARALPRIDQLMLLHMNRGDFSVMGLRAKSRAALECAKGLMLMLLLIVLCAAIARPLAVILAIQVLSTIAISVAVARHPVEHGQTSPWAKMRSQPDHYIEILMMVGLIIGFLLITQKGGLISGTVLILMIARFSGALRNAAVHMINLIRWHNRDIATWARQEAQKSKKLGQAQRLAKKAQAAVKPPPKPPEKALESPAGTQPENPPDQAPGNAPANAGETQPGTTAEKPAA